MKQLTIKHPWSMTFKGKPSLEILNLEKSSKIGLLPSSIPFFKPRLLVKEGDLVKIGTPIFKDKKTESIQFCSPAAGRVSEINYGERRAIESVVIDVSETEEKEVFTQFSKEALDSVDRASLVSHLLKMGLWPMLKSFPFYEIANPELTPPSIFISLDDDEPHKPSSEVLLKDRVDQLHYGLAILKKLCPTVKVSASDQNPLVKTELKSVVTHLVSGVYPANSPGAVLYHQKKDASENSAWFIGLQNLLQMAEALQSGSHPTHMISVLSGEKVDKPQHIVIRRGASLQEVLNERASMDNARVIAGGLFTGRSTNNSSYLGYYEDAIQVIREKDESEFMAFLKLGLEKVTYSRAYLYSFFKRHEEVTQSAALNGSLRSCIACGKCEEVCPVDIPQQILFKTIQSDDIETAMTQGLLDCSGCNLCTYVCPSKIELSTIVSDAKAALHKELHTTHD
ncbi:hypothetical protein DID77_01070 [Candidatus Marinamargulisbacteria bacterium SCGC AG-439-L15]|nr:hypothetical protein DID77_01070 [Candidatus Marinamargulisbacteria bacterium SCGC AG-439-L15]